MGRHASSVVVAVLLFALVALSGCAGGTAQAQSGKPDATAADTIENKGSDTLVNLALAWAEALHGREHPNARISVTGGGSGTGIAAMINGTVDIANASRAMKAEEIDAAKSERHRSGRAHGRRVTRSPSSSIRPTRSTA